MLFPPLANTLLRLCIEQFVARHFENDFQFNRGPERKACNAVHKTARVLFFFEDVLRNSDAPSATFGWSRTSPEVATETPSRTMRITLSSDARCRRAASRASSLSVPCDCPFALNGSGGADSSTPSSFSFCSAVEGWFFAGVLMNVLSSSSGAVIETPRGVL